MRCRTLDFKLITLGSLVGLFSLCYSGYILTGCSSNKKEFDEAEKLAHQFCGSCHAFPSPYSLDKKTWVYSVLPAMGPRLGIRAANGIIYKYNAPKGTLPDEAAMTQGEWDKIVQYYYTLAPDTLLSAPPKIPNNLKQFTYRATAFRAKSPVTTLVKIDPLNHSIYVCDGEDYKIRVFDSQLNFKGEAPTYRAVSSITLDTMRNGEREATLLKMGILNPNDVVSGGLQKFPSQKI